MRKVIVRGEEYPSVKHAWRAVSDPLGITYKMVLNRLWLGWGMEEALTHKPNDRRSKTERITMRTLKNGDIEISFPGWGTVTERISKAMGDSSQVKARALARIEHFKMAVED